MRKCESCGKAYSESKDVFCPHCDAVAKKKCDHGSSFDSGRYDRGEIYSGSADNSVSQYSPYKQGGEPHVQRSKYQYNRFEDTFGDAGKNSDETPRMKYPDFIKLLQKSNNKGKPFKSGLLLAIVLFIAFNAFVTFAFFAGNIDGTLSFGEPLNEIYVEESLTDFYAIAEEASVEIIGEDRGFKDFVIKINGVAFEDTVSEEIIDDIYSGAFEEKMISEDGFVELQLCKFSKDIVSEESYDNAMEDCLSYSGEKNGDGCCYKFSFNFVCDEIVHIPDGVSFYLPDDSFVKVELPFSAFSVSEDGVITYYSSYADYDTAWNTVFSECSGYQASGRELIIDFND